MGTHHYYFHPSLVQIFDHVLDLIMKLAFGLYLLLASAYCLHAKSIQTERGLASTNEVVRDIHDRDAADDHLQGLGPFMFDMMDMNESSSLTLDEFMIGDNDQRDFQAADKDNDGELDLDEFVTFL